jgi:hypothetical protein
MHEKELRLLARVLPHMAAQWRLHADLELLAERPDGRIVIDVLAGEARHPAAGPLDLALARELRTGLHDQLARKGIARATVIEAALELAYDTSRVRTDRDRIVHFDFRIAARIRTQDGLFEGSQEEEHVWHSRDPDG